MVKQNLGFANKLIARSCRNSDQLETNISPRKIEFAMNYKILDFENHRKKKKRKKKA